MADYWLEEKQLVHKLFKVLAPRYAEYRSCYTSLYLAPNVVRTKQNEAVLTPAVLELKGNRPMPHFAITNSSNPLDLA